jgi:hypothetical protein
MQVVFLKVVSASQRKHPSLYDGDSVTFAALDKTEVVAPPWVILSV